MDALASRPYAVAAYDHGTSKYRARRYRERAEELRTIADDLLHNECRRTLLGLANTYDRMAAQAEGLH